MTKTLYVGNLAPETTEDRLRDLFATDDREVISVKLAVYSKKGKSRGFGFVELGSEEDAAAALLALQGTNVDGREIKLGEAVREKRGAPTSRDDDDYGGGRFGSGGGGGRRGRR